ncbi:MAG: LysM peptidoglycan-binding domain-containing protein [Chloroflexota bacterium]
MALSRVHITTDGDPPIEIQASGSSRVFFNPSQYSIEKKVHWTQTRSRGLDLPQLQFDAGGSRTLSLSLTFDTYGASPPTDVRQLTRQVAQLAEVVSGLDRPPVCTVTWGPAVDRFAGLPFVGVVESLSQKFTLFLEDGTPVRASIDVQFREVESPEKQLKRKARRRSSPIQSRTRVFRQGDSLWSIAAAEYRDPARWRPIAEANGITNPLRIEPGTVLLIPSVD